MPYFLLPEMQINKASYPPLMPLLLLLWLSRFSRVRLCDPIDSSQLGFSVPGILQARILEWAAISFTNARKWKVKVKSISRNWLLATPWTAAYQAPPSMGFSRKEYWVGCHCLLCLMPHPSPKKAMRLLSIFFNLLPFISLESATG